MEIPATKFGASGKDIAVQQKVLAVINNKIEVKRKELNFLDSLYHKILSKIVDFHEKNIIVLEDEEKELIIKKNYFKVSEKEVNNLKIENEELTASVNDKKIILNSVESDIIKLEARLSRKQKSLDLKIKTIDKKLSDKNLKFKVVSNKLLKTEQELTAAKEQKDLILQYVKDKETEIEDQAESMSDKWKDLYIYEKRVQKKISETYPGHKIKLK